MVSKEERGPHDSEGEERGPCSFVGEGRTVHLWVF